MGAHLDASVVEHRGERRLAPDAKDRGGQRVRVPRAQLEHASCTAALNGPFVPVSRSKISGAITVQKAVDIATSAPLTKGARVVGASLVRVVTVPAVLTTTVWLVLVDPPVLTRACRSGAVRRVRAAV